MHLVSLSRTAAWLSLSALLAGGAPLAARAQEAGSDADPTLLANVGAADIARDRQIQVGVLAAYSPGFLGSKDYQLRALPDIQVRYDRLFLSFQDGLGYDVVRGDGWRAGPAIAFRPNRPQDGDSPFRIGGRRSDALRGLGTVKATADIGGYVAYQRGGVSAKLDVRQAVSGGKGMIASLSVRHSARFPVPWLPAAGPAILSIGPRLSVVDDDFSQTYFGVTAGQSLRSGLRPYRAEGGLLSAGIGASALVPVTGRISGILLAGYDRLAGDAARSPLVEERGSRNQATIGLGLSYRFGL